MSFQFIQRSGEWLEDGKFFTFGYAGHGAGVNNPDMAAIKLVGPLPVGVYRIGDPVDGTHLGPCAMPLKPDVANEMFGRGDFFIHADKMDALINPRQASEGCIVLYQAGRLNARQVREHIAAAAHAGDRMLTVVAERSDAQWILPPPSL